MDSLTLIMQIDTLSMRSDTITFQVDALVKNTDTSAIQPIVRIPSANYIFES